MRDDREGHQCQLAKRHQEMMQITGNDIAGQQEYAFQKLPELAEQVRQVLEACTPLELSTG